LVATHVLGRRLGDKHINLRSSRPSMRFAALGFEVKVDAMQ